MCTQLINGSAPQVIFDAATNELIKIAKKKKKKLKNTENLPK